MGAGAPQSSENPTGPSFEVASVRILPLVFGGATKFGISISGSRVTISGTLTRLLMEAYDVLDYQILGAPQWARSVESNYFRIEAKVEGDGQPTRAHVKEMLQTLLAERFQLRLHRETQQRQILALVVGKDGVKMKESQPDARSGLTFRAGDLNGSKLNMTYFANFLSNQLKVPVVDQTELKGFYDVVLHWTPDETSAPQEASTASVYAAIQEQLGLKLVAQKGDMQVLVIDHVAKPAEN